MKTLHVHEPDNPPMAYVRGKEKEAERALNEGRYISPFMAYMNLNRGNTRDDSIENDFFDEDEEEDNEENEDEDEFVDGVDGEDEDEDTEYWADVPSTSEGRGQTQLPFQTQPPSQPISHPRATTFFLSCQSSK